MNPFACRSSFGHLGDGGGGPNPPSRRLGIGQGRKRGSDRRSLRPAEWTVENGTSQRMVERSSHQFLTSQPFSDTNASTVRVHDCKLTFKPNRKINNEAQLETSVHDGSIHRVTSSLISIHQRPAEAAAISLSISESKAMAL